MRALLFERIERLWGNVRSYRYQIRTYQVTLRLLQKPSERVRSRDDAMVLLAGIFKKLDADREHFVILALDHLYNCIGYRVVASGTRKAVIIEPSMVIQDAVRLGAHAIVSAHNHTSARQRPSKTDRQFGESLVDLAARMKVKICDQIVLRWPAGARTLHEAWSEAETERLRDLVASKTPVSRMARLLGRSTADIKARAAEMLWILPRQKRYQ